MKDMADDPVERTLSFLESCIKSGENWTETCVCQVSEALAHYHKLKEELAQVKVERDQAIKTGEFWVAECHKNEDIAEIRAKEISKLRAERDLLVFKPPSPC